MKPNRTIVLAFAAALAPPMVFAACPAETAARNGAAQGYNRDRTAAIETEKRESASSEMLGKCIGGITSVIVVPTFPSLGDIFARARDKVCHVASDRIREATSIPGFGMPGLPSTSIPVPIIPSQPQTVPASASTNFWERIWR